MFNYLNSDHTKFYQQLPERLRKYLMEYPRASFGEDVLKIQSRELMRKDWVASIEADCKSQELANKTSFDVWRPPGLDIGMVCKVLGCTHWRWPDVEIIGFERDDWRGLTVIVTEYNPPGLFSCYWFHPDWLQPIKV